MTGRVIGAVDAARVGTEVPGGQEPLNLWQDRLGHQHAELRSAPHRGEPSMDRVVGPLETAWRASDDPASLTQEALARPNPFIEPDPDDPELALWTWTVEDAEARAVVLWTNPVFDHADVAKAEFTRLPGSDLWTICLRLPAALRGSYRIGSWREDGPAPWRATTGRRPVILAAMGSSTADPRCLDVVHGSGDEPSSVASGPRAPRELWRGLAQPADITSQVDDLPLPHGERAWVYSPGVGTATPLLVLYDGQVWRRMGLPALLDAAIGAGVLPPLHVALVDSGDQPHRWATLGVPGGQVDVVIDELLPRVRAGWHVDPATTLVSGQSLGGIAALWTLALSGGEVQHAIAQSASLWRFDVVEALMREPAWASIELQAGTFEGDMLEDARALAATLGADPRTAGRHVRCTGYEAGHDWAVWRANLFSALALHLRDQRDPD
ncbi:MAG: DUF3327 domain-containing protein [Arachnia sp.]